MKKALLIILVVFAFSCEGDEDGYPNCSAVLCPADQFFLTYRNTAGDTLIGTTFVKDSFKLSSPSDVIFIKPVAGNSGNISIFYQQLESDIKYTLELSDTEIDTLNFNSVSITANCCIDSSMSELLYNNSTVTAESEDFYVIIKE